MVFGTTAVTSVIGGLHLVEHVHLPVAARLAVLLLPVGVLPLLEQDVAVLFRRRIRMLQADGGTAGFGNGGAVVVKVVVGDRHVSPAGFTPGGLPLSPLPLQCCLGLEGQF